MAELDPNAIAPTGIHSNWWGIPDEEKDPRIMNYDGDEINRYVLHRYVAAPTVSIIFSEELDEIMDEWDDDDREYTWDELIKDALDKFKRGVFMEDEV